MSLFRIALMNDVVVLVQVGPGERDLLFGGLISNLIVDGMPRNCRSRCS